MRRRAIVQVAGVLLVAAALCGCVSGRTLTSQRECEPYRELSEKWGNLGLRAVCVPTVDARGRSAPIAVYSGGNAEGVATVVFLHGVFSDHESWRFVAAELAEDHRVVLVDLLGCGASAGAFAEDWYGEADTFGLDAMAERTVQAIEAGLAGQQGQASRRVVIAAHSMGGAIALRMFASERLRAAHAGFIDRVDGLFLVAPLDVAIEKADPSLAKVATINGVEIALGDLTGRLRAVVAQTVGESVGPHAVALQEEVEKRLEILRDGRKRRATQAMLRSAVQSQERTRFKPDWAWIAERTAETRRVEEPALIIWGEQDETLPASMGYKLWALLPYSELRVFQGVKHSPQLEHPLEVASMLREFAAPGSVIARTPHDSPDRMIVLPDHRNGKGESR